MCLVPNSCLVIRPRFLACLNCNTQNCAFTLMQKGESSHWVPMHGEEPPQCCVDYVPFVLYNDLQVENDFVGRGNFVNSFLN